MYAERVAVRRNNTRAAYHQHNEMFWAHRSQSARLNRFERRESELAAPLLLDPKKQGNSLSTGVAGVRVDVGERLYLQYLPSNPQKSALERI